MKLFIIAVCAIAAVSADVSHLTGHGYNYDKPAAAFDLPPQMSAPTNEYLAPSSVEAHHEEYHQISQGPSNEYLPPQTQYNAPPVYHPEISQSQYAGSASTPVLQQGPSSEYLPPQAEHTTPVEASVRPEMPHTIPAVQPLYNAPVSTPVHHHEISQNVAASQAVATATNEYLPPHTQYGAPIQAADHHEPSQSITAPVNEYLPPQQQYHPEVSQTVSQPLYSAPHPAPVHHQPKYSAPAVQTVAEPANEYLPPHQHYNTPAQAPQELPQQFSSPSSEYLPPTEHHHHEHQHHEHHDHEHHHHEDQQESQATNQGDGYHYDAPSKRFRF